MTEQQAQFSTPKEMLPPAPEANSQQIEDCIHELEALREDILLKERLHQDVKQSILKLEAKKEELALRRAQLQDQAKGMAEMPQLCRTELGKIKQVTKTMGERLAKLALPPSPQRKEVLPLPKTLTRQALDLPSNFLSKCYAGCGLKENRAYNYRPRATHHFDVDLKLRQLRLGIFK